MGVVGELRPVLGAEANWMFGERSLHGNGQVTGKNTAAKKAFPIAVGGKLKITVLIAIGNATFNGIRYVFQIAYLDDPAHLDPVAQAQLYRSDDPEQSITTNGETKQLRIILAVAVVKLAFGVQDGKRLHVAYDGLLRERPSVDIGSQRAAQREFVGAGLLLHDGPLVLLPFLRLMEILNQLRPLNSGFNVEHPLIAVEVEHPVQTSGIHQQGSVCKLLPTHGVTATGNRDHTALVAGFLDDQPAFFHRGRLEDLVHECGIQLRVNIIHRNAFGLRYHGWRSGTAILHFGTSAETQGAGRHGSCLHESTAGDSIFMELLRCSCIA